MILNTLAYLKAFLSWVERGVKGLIGLKQTVRKEFFSIFLTGFVTLTAWLVLNRKEFFSSFVPPRQCGAVVYTLMGLKSLAVDWTMRVHLETTLK